MITRGVMGMVRTGSQQSSHWFTWMSWWTIIYMPAFGLAFIKWGILTTLGVSAAIAFLSTPVVVALTDGDGREGEPPGTPREPSPARIIRIIRVGLCTAESFLALMLLAQLSGALWLVFAALMVATAPPSVALWRKERARLSQGRERTRAPDDEAATPGAPVSEASGPQAPVSEVPGGRAEPALGGGEFHDFTDVQLCCLWRHSFWDLNHAPFTDERERIVLERQKILEELTRRNASAIEAWLASGARASSSPERFFNGGDADHPATA